MNTSFQSIRAAAKKAPWWLDVCSGAFATYWGIWTLDAPNQIADQPSFNFLDAIDLALFSLVIIALGLTQIMAAFLEAYWWRKAVAVPMIIFNSLITFGIIYSQPAPGVTGYSAWAFANIVILVVL